MSMVNKLPPVPQDVDYSDYVIYYVNGNYRVSFFDTLSNPVLDSSSCLHNDDRIIYDYNSETDSWDYFTGYLAGTSYTDFSPGGEVEIIASTVDIYNNDGTVFCYGSSVPYRDGISLIGDSLSGSDFASVLGDLWTVTPLLLVVVLGLVGFRKAWGFLHNLIRGA